MKMFCINGWKKINKNLEEEKMEFMKNIAPYIVSIITAIIAYCQAKKGFKVEIEKLETILLLDFWKKPQILLKIGIQVLLQ